MERLGGKGHRQNIIREEAPGEFDVSQMRGKRKEKGGAGCAGGGIWTMEKETGRKAVVLKAGVGEGS